MLGLSLKDANSWEVVVMDLLGVSSILFALVIIVYILYNTAMRIKGYSQSTRKSSEVRMDKKEYQRI